ncbi:bacterial transcriptional activator domain-containing protein [Streptomyces sp. WELS2]|uniref:AfsR/SARP family transcriptional regulator n=1 Tax=Streptomyces sp. WELS2 TaxID=2749435 RepID=UPI0015F0B782|nr:bacterial transcriptional activator domain-containing protein [Streptomyces sp. WELS2]
MAFLALQKDGTQRAWAAEHLWPDCTPYRAAGNLRSALCHARRSCAVPVVETIGQSLRLAPTVRVDLHEACRAGDEVTSGHSPPPGTETELIEALRQDLLPEWPEDWLVIERERWDQLRLHVLETLAQQLQETHRFVPALQVALAAVGIDPVRETARRIVMEVHIAEGNVASAYKCYRDYKEMLERELSISPSQRMRELVEELMPR